MKPWDELTIRDNYLFKKVMTLNDNLCRRLLERVLGIAIAKMDIIQSEQEIDTDYKAKSVRLDVYAEDDSGRVYDIEMQAADMKDAQLFLRTRYYQSLIDQGLLEKGQPYSRLRQSYIIFVCDFDPFNLGLRRYTFRNRCDERTELALPDRAVRIFLNAHGTQGEENEDVLGFLDYVSSNAAAGGFATELAGAVKTFKENSKERSVYMSLAMDIQEYIEKEKDSWAAEAKAQNSREIAMRLLQNGVPAEQVAIGTGLSVEEVRKMSEEK